VWPRTSAGAPSQLSRSRRMHYILLQMFISSIYLRNNHHLLQLIDGGGSGGSVRCINGGCGGSYSM